MTPEQAVEAAYALVAAEGPAGLSMRKLASSLHVSLPTIYTAIQNKDRLVGEIQDLVLADVMAAFGGVVGVDARTQLETMGEALFGWADDHPGLTELLLAEEVSPEVCARALDAAPEPARAAVRHLVEGLLGADGAQRLDPVAAVVFATAAGRAMLSTDRSRPDVGRGTWLRIWAHTIVDGMEVLAERSPRRASRAP